MLTISIIIVSNVIVVDSKGVSGNSNGIIKIVDKNSIVTSSAPDLIVDSSVGVGKKSGVPIGIPIDVSNSGDTSVAKDASSDNIDLPVVVSVVFAKAKCNVAPLAKNPGL